MIGARAEVKRLSRGEHALVTVARALVAPRSASVSVLLTRDLRPGEVPDALSPTAMELLRRTMAVGGVQQLARLGGWRVELSLGADGTPRRGRLWQRHPEPTPLSFGAPSFHLCRWLAAGAPTEAAALPPDGPLSSGDELLHSLALGLIRGETMAEAFSRLPTARRSRLGWLLFPEVLVRGGPCLLTAEDYEDALEGAGALVFEALGPELTRRLVALERSKSGLREPEALARLGQAQAAALEALLDSLDRRGRRDLATFLVDAAVELLADGDGPSDLARLYRGHLTPTAPLAERFEAQRTGAAPLWALATLSRWNDEHRYVRVFEDEYEAAQALVSRWEELGREGFDRAAAAAAQLESIDSVVAP